MREALETARLLSKQIGRQWAAGFVSGRLYNDKWLKVELRGTF